ncbi:MAG: helix-turn-helix domain-containing protein [Lachnospiraceae bacterium]|nr:helix-turn-helix domain-containing protein [Lachnospiraceae bacterium]
MTSLFEDLQEGLNLAIAYERGKGSAKVKTLIILPVKKYTNVEIRSIRNKSGMTQATLANYLGVSKKTVEAWETGRTHPTGLAYRLLEILEQGKEDELSFVNIEQ